MAGKEISHGGHHHTAFERIKVRKEREAMRLKIRFSFSLLGSPRIKCVWASKYEYEEWGEI